MFASQLKQSLERSYLEERSVNASGEQPKAWDFN